MSGLLGGLGIFVMLSDPCKDLMPLPGIEDLPRMTLIGLNSPIRCLIWWTFWPGIMGLILLELIIPGLASTLCMLGRGPVLDVMVIAELFFSEPGMFAGDGREPKTKEKY